MKPGLFALLPLACSLLAQVDVKPSDIVLKVPGREFTRSEFEAMSLGVKSDVSPAGRLAAAARIQGSLAMAEEARRRGLDNDPVIKGRIQVAVAEALSKVLFEHLLAEIKKDEPAVRRYYETHQSPAEERELSQILVRFRGSPKPLRPGQKELTEAEAKARIDSIHAKLLAGADFAALARAESDDLATAAKGGDLGLQTIGTLLDEFGNRAFALAPGKFSEPIKSRDGWHIVLVRRVLPPTFEMVRRGIEHEMAVQQLRKFAETGIETNASYFGVTPR